MNHSRVVTVIHKNVSRKYFFLLDLFIWICSESVHAYKKWAFRYTQASYRNRTLFLLPIQIKFFDIYKKKKCGSPIHTTSTASKQVNQQHPTGHFIILLLRWIGKWMGTVKGSVARRKGLCFPLNRSSWWDGTRSTHQKRGKMLVNHVAWQAQGTTMNITRSCTSHLLRPDTYIHIESMYLNRYMCSWLWKYSGYS